MSALKGSSFALTLEGLGGARKLSVTHSRAVIVVLDPLDIGFAEAAAGLHFDKLESDLAGIFQTMRGAARHLDRYILVQHLQLVADRTPARCRAPSPPSLRDNSAGSLRSMVCVQSRRRWVSPAVVRIRVQWSITSRQR
jgi:hypothetical protein